MISNIFNKKNYFFIYSLLVLNLVFSLSLRTESIKAQKRNIENTKADNTPESNSEKPNFQKILNDPTFDNNYLFCGGVSDSFACPSESALRDTAIVNMLTNRYATTPCFAFLNFDDIPWRSGGCINEKMGFFIHKLTFPAGLIEDASLEIKCRAASKSETNYDYISFFQGTNYLGSSFFKDLPGAFGTWNNNQQATFVLNLKNLPTLPGFDYTNIMEFIQDGDLDVVIGTETGVDYMCLNIAKSLVANISFGWQAMFIPDTLQVYLRQITSPYNVVDSQSVLSSIVSFNYTSEINKSDVDETYTARTNKTSDLFNSESYFKYSNKPIGANPDMPGSYMSVNLNLSKLFGGNSYYFVLKHRNSIETWSANGIMINGNGPTLYDFRTSPSQAFGGNMIMIGGIASIYQGDVNQDGIIDLADVSLVEYDSQNFITGYVITDLNGDYYVDLSDLLIADNNGFNFVGIIRP